MKALVLKKTLFGESDLIVRFLTENGEVASGFAAGAKKSKRRFPHQFDISGLYDLEWGKKTSKDKLTRLQSCDLITYDAALSSNIEALCRWAVILEWISVDEEQRFSFEEVVSLRSALTKKNGISLFHSFFWKQLRSHGILPEIEVCEQCKKELSGRLFFDFQGGGVVHALCGRGVSVSLETLEYLFQILNVSDSEFIEMTSLSEMELDQITLPFLEWQMGRTFKAKKVFDETVRRNPPPSDWPPDSIAPRLDC